jgi:hypothetical protein
VLALSGGLPIKVGDDVVGTVGLSGSPGNDDDCSQAGIDKVAAQLKWADIFIVAGPWSSRCCGGTGRV